MSEVITVENPMFDIQENLAEDISVDWCQYRDYRHLNVNDEDALNSLQDYRIDIYDRDEYFRPAKGYLELEFKLTNPNGTDFAANENVSLQNNAIGLMRRYELWLDDKELDDLEDADISSTVHNCVYFSNEYSSTIAQQMLWFPDTVDSINISNTLINENNIANNTVQFYNFTTGVNVALISNGTNITVSNSVAGNEIRARITYNGIVYPVTFYLITPAGDPTIATLQVSAGLTLETTAGAQYDKVVAYLNTFGTEITFLSGNKPALFTISGVGTVILITNTANLDGVTGVTSWAGLNGQDINTNLETVNYGHRKRRQLLLNSKSYVAHIPLTRISGFLRAYDKVTKGVKLEFRMIRNLDQRIVMGSVPSIVKMKRVRIWIPRIVPNVVAKAKLEAKLLTELTYEIPFNDLQIFRSRLINAPTDEQLFQVKPKRTKPVKVYVVFQTAARLGGDNTTVKRVFDNVSVTNMRITINGEKYPEYPYITSFSATSPDYSRLYDELLKCGLRDHDIEQGTVVTYENFPTLFPIFSFDCSEGYKRMISPGAAIINLYWSQPTYDPVANPYYVWVVVESERTAIMSNNKGQMKFLSVKN